MVWVFLHSEVFCWVNSKNRITGMSKLSDTKCWGQSKVSQSNVIDPKYSLVFLIRLILFNRYLAICYPFKHKNFVGKNVTIAIVMTYVNGMVANCLCFVQVSGQTIWTNCYWYLKHLRFSEIQAELAKFANFAYFSCQICLILQIGQILSK